MLNWIMMAATATTAYRFYNSFRLERVQMWSPITISTTTNVGTQGNQCTLEWYGPTSGWNNSNKFIASQDGDRPAYLDCRPPKGATVGMWMQSGSSDADSTATVLAVGGPLGAFLDVTFSCKLVDDESPFGAEAPSGATVGKVYYNYLDGLSSGVLFPSGVNVVPGPSYGPGHFRDLEGDLQFNKVKPLILWFRPKRELPVSYQICCLASLGQGPDETDVRKASEEPTGSSGVSARRTLFCDTDSDYAEDVTTCLVRERVVENPAIHLCHCKANCRVQE